jgi:ribA/ribD-fused uncharacterized protein
LDVNEKTNWLLVTGGIRMYSNLATLSNMSDAAGPFAFPETTIDGATLGPLAQVPTSEHVFQTFKALIAGRVDRAERVLAAAHPTQCKVLTSRRSMGRMDAETLARWERLSPVVMLAVARAKFANPAAAEALRSTGTATLVERLPRFGDTKWGVNSKGIGANLMGQILMRIRDDCSFIHTYE